MCCYAVEASGTRYVPVQGSGEEGKQFTGLMKSENFFEWIFSYLTLSLLMSYIYWATFKDRNYIILYIYIYIYIYGPRFGNAESRLFLFAAQCFNIKAESFPVSQLCVNILSASKITLIKMGFNSVA
jgi:hypothetical protein